MRVLVSLALVDEDRSWLSLARRHGCCDTCTLLGRLTPMVGEGRAQREMSDRGCEEEVLLIRTAGVVAGAPM